MCCLGYVASGFSTQDVGFLGLRVRLAVLGSKLILAWGLSSLLPMVLDVNGARQWARMVCSLQKCLIDRFAGFCGPCLVVC